MVKIQVAAFDGLDIPVLYEILRLRAEVFVAEQHCPYVDLDGRDREPSARHLWAADEAGSVLGYLRVLEEPDGCARVGRVVVAPAARGTGLAQQLLRTALDVIGERTSVLSAQSHLEGFYARFGYRTCGPGFDEDGIAHVPMIRRP